MIIHINSLSAKPFFQLRKFLPKLSDAITGDWLNRNTKFNVPFSYPMFSSFTTTEDIFYD